MALFIFQGRVLPERAQLHFHVNEVKIEFPNAHWIISVSIILNQVTVFLEADSDDIFTMRNFVHDFVSSQLSVIAFTHGNFYDVELTRVVTPDRKVDWVFGIDMPCIVDLKEKMHPILSPETLGEMAMSEGGHYLRRFFTDFSQAMKNATDTSFYCFRALEALRQYSYVLSGAEPTEKNKKDQWDIFRRHSQTSKEDFIPIEKSAQSVRHGGVEEISDADRQKLLTTTWLIAEKFFSSGFLKLID